MLIVATAPMAAVSLEILVPADVNCATWHNEPNYKTTAKSWLIGYVSGINASGFYGDQTDLLMGTPEHSIYHWMDGYCKSNPRGTVHAGANALLRDLYNSAQKRRVANNSAGR